MPTVALDGATLDYEIAGPDDGRPVVFIHGFLMGHSLWRGLSERLAARGMRCLAPTWPLGAHAAPVRNRDELTIEAVAGMVGGLLDEFSLDDVVLLGNDTGGVIAQVVATRYAARLGALVLTSCDAFEHFPPPWHSNRSSRRRIGRWRSGLRSSRCAAGRCGTADSGRLPTPTSTISWRSG